ncbi:sugar ABC transporter ATP-binding protein [Nocardiopsis sp. YSL2]|uniref:sugar ABC transporter ATP-binding protein n=1 Tax=Nocardiopsis sp. YSL2 TaxID=2939492 RepID=UPI0026F46F64|nr:sugar ABC transporter ATP-binding protein [Nocardiopsis sp. YSL2]
MTTAHDPPPLAEAVGVGRRFGSTTALHEVDLTVHPGRSHALVGRNGAGKSTLVSILTGLSAPDTGHVRFQGGPAPALADREGWRTKVACVYQRSTAVAHLTVAENLFVHRQPLNRLGLIDWRRMRRTARDLLDQWGVHVDVDRQVRDLGVEDRQLVEIARALSHGARFVVLDEPTAQLDKAGIDRLFTRMRDLQDRGVTFLYISHHLQEVYEVCQDVTVLRDARHIVTAPVADLPRSALIEAMTGTAEELTEGVPEPRVSPTAPPRLEVLGLSGDGFEGVDLTVRSGEVVGLAGSSASGKAELAETLVGLRAAAAGTVAVDGTAHPTGDVPTALAAGIGCVPRDRHHQGLVPELTVGENATLTIGDRLGPAGFVRPDRRRAFGRRMITDLDIRTQGTDQSVSALSGGNQQKVVMARALATRPRVLVLLNPTAGVDVKSKEALLGVIDSVREEGTAVLVVSDELDDLRRCDRVVVLFHGEAVAEHPAGWRDADLVASIEGVHA